MYGKDFDPIMKAAENAFRMQEIATAGIDTEEEFDQRKDCVNAWEKIGQYCSPKLKAIEVSGEVKSALSFVLEDILEDDYTFLDTVFDDVFVWHIWYRKKGE